MILFGSALPTLLSVILSMYNYKLYRYRHSLYMGMAWLFLVGGELLLAYSYLTLDLFVYRLGVIFGAPLLFSIVILLDSISRLDLDLWKFGVSVVVTTGLVITAFDEGSVGYNLSVIGEVGPILRGNFLFWGFRTWWLSLALLHGQALHELPGIHEAICEVGPFIRHTRRTGSVPCIYLRSRLDISWK